ncbi:FAD-dependent oxidoreductase [Candidatus Woesearchaeota archaeon]|nr:FAD-dependent oxidoreductase [Candidatus Woesearchaeota archaeon]
MKMDRQTYDLIIVGAGPAGLTASIYASRFGINHLVIGTLIDGRMAEAHKVCNFPSEVDINGYELVRKMEGSVKNYGAALEPDKVAKVTKKDNGFLIKTMGGKEFLSKTLLIAIGAERKKLIIPDEEKFLGRGVSYCATCDAAFFKNKIVAVVGGNSAALTTADYLADLAKKVYVIHGEDKLKADKLWQEHITKNPKIELVLGNKIKILRGENSLEFVILEKGIQGKNELKIDGIFVELGIDPNTRILNEFDLEKDGNDFIKIKEDGSTNIRGIWAAGDITSGSNNFRQIVTACSEGAIAANSIHSHLKS